MSQSTDALLAFGFDLGDSEDMPEAFQGLQFFDFEEWLCDEYEIEVVDGNYTEYRARLARARQECGVAIESHCSGEYPMYFMHVPGTLSRATRGNPMTVDTHEVPAEKIALMKAFCDKYEIPWKEPKWQIFSMWN